MDKRTREYKDSQKPAENVPLDDGTPKKEYADPGISVGKDYERPDPMAVKNKQPGMHYRWLSKDPDRMSVRQDEGYEIVKGNHPELTGTNQSADNVVKRGDLILGKIPMEKKIARDKFFRDQALAMAGQSSSKLKRDLGKYGKNVTEELK